MAAGGSIDANKNQAIGMKEKSRHASRTKFPGHFEIVAMLVELNILPASYLIIPKGMNLQQDPANKQALVSCLFAVVALTSPRLGERAKRPPNNLFYWVRIQIGV